MKQMAITWIEQAVDSGARYHKACWAMGIDSRTLRRWRQTDRPLEDQRKHHAQLRHHPQALTQDEKQAIIDVCNSPPYQSLPPSQIVPRLADQGVYLASESSFYRVLKQHQQDQRRGRAKPPRKIPAPTAWLADAPNKVWSWDITYLPSDILGKFLRLYMIIDIYSRAIVGWEVHAQESSDHAARLIHRACSLHGIKRHQLTLHSDNGSPMKGATMLATLQQLGIVPSFSRPSVSDDNPYSEAMFRTLKYTPAYPAKPFESIHQARTWVHNFVTWYNTQHRHSGIAFVTPEQRHQGQDHQILQKRKSVYEAAKRQMPNRWKSRTTRQWQGNQAVWLNPKKERSHPLKTMV
jgi:transposase InsO family protein